MNILISFFFLVSLLVVTFLIHDMMKSINNSYEKSIQDLKNLVDELRSKKHE
jgi:hypothetical protein